MNQPFNFCYYGLLLQCQSENFLWTKILTDKFVNFKPGATHSFTTQKIVFNFHNFSSSEPLINYEIYSPFLYLADNKLLLKHDYLLTSTSILYRFHQEKLHSIDFYFKSNFLFELANFLSQGILKTQLFQNLLQLYLEQALLFILCRENKLNCLHAAAVEKKSQVFIFAGLNGVGKSTLAQQLVARFGYQHFADNYLLIDKKYAYFAPDTIRLNKKSLKFLKLPAKNYFGFSKYNVDLSKEFISSYLKSKIKAIFLISRSQQKYFHQESKNKILSTILNLQIINQEEIKTSPLAQYFSHLDLSLGKYPSCSYYSLNLKNL